MPREVYLRHSDRGKCPFFCRWGLFAGPFPLSDARLRIGSDAVTGGMGCLSQRAAVFLLTLYDYPAARFLSSTSQRQSATDRPGFQRILRPPASAAPRAGRGDGSIAYGNGDRLRLPQVPKGEGERTPEGLTPARHGSFP